MVTQGQAIWAGLAAVASNITWQNKVIAGHELSLSAFSDCIIQFEDLHREIKHTLARSTMGIYMQKPRSYVEPPAKKRERWSLATETASLELEPSVPSWTTTTRRRTRR